MAVFDMDKAMRVLRDKYYMVIEIELKKLQQKIFNQVLSANNGNSEEVQDARNSQIHGQP